MVEILADTSLFESTGGEAPSLHQLQRRYTVQAFGHSADRSQGWFNWIVIPKGGGVPMGFVQVTLEQKAPEMVANIAWVISPIHEGQGLACEAATAMARWLKVNGVNSLEAYAHPEPHASMGVARNHGPHPTDMTEDMEIRWES